MLSARRRAMVSFTSVSAKAGDGEHRQREAKDSTRRTAAVRATRARAPRGKDRGEDNRLDRVVVPRAGAQPYEISREQQLTRQVECEGRIDFARPPGPTKNGGAGRREANHRDNQSQYDQLADPGDSREDLDDGQAPPPGRSSAAPVVVSTRRQRPSRREIAATAAAASTRISPTHFQHEHQHGKPPAFCQVEG